MYRELTKKNNYSIDRNDIISRQKIRISFRLRLARFSLLCIFAFSVGLLIAYLYRTELASFDGEISEYFGIFSSSVGSTYFDRMVKICFKDFFALLLLLLSALTFFCNAMTNALLALCALFWGICSGVLVFGHNMGVNGMLYVGQALALLVLFVFVSQTASSFNLAVIGKRSKVSVASDSGTPSISPIMVKYILKAAGYIFAYLIIKTVYCIFQLAIQ